MTTQTQQSVPYREAYSVPEVAQLLGGASKRWVDELIATGELPSVKIGGRRLVARADLLAFIERMRADERKARAAVTPTRHEFGTTA